MEMKNKSFYDTYSVSNSNPAYRTITDGKEHSDEVSIGATPEVSDRKLMEDIMKKLEKLSKLLEEDISPKRDEDYMEDFMNELIDIWQEFPELRFGQLLCNVLRDPSLYYVEDEDLLKKVRDYYTDLLVQSHKDWLDAHFDLISE